MNRMSVSLCVARILNNHRKAEAGQDLWRSPGLIPVLRQVHQDRVQRY